MPSNHLILCCPLLFPPSIFPSIRVFSDGSVLRIRWPKYWSFCFNISPSNEHPGLISFRMDWLDLLAVQGTFTSLLQHHSSEASVLRCSAFFIVQLSHPYMTTGKTTALTRWTFVDRPSLIEIIWKELLVDWAILRTCLLCDYCQCVGSKKGKGLKAGPEHRASCHIVFPYSWILAHICPQWVPKFFSLNQESESENEVAQSCPTLCDPMDCSLPGSSVHRLFQARVLEWVAISFSRRSSWPRDWTRVSHIVGKCLTIWATREPPESSLTRSSPEIENVTTYMLIFFKKNNLFIPSIIKHFIEI